MNNFSKLRCTLLYTFFALNLFAQQDTNWVEQMHDPNANFYNVQQAFENYWQGKTIEKGKGYKQFKRWEDYMAPRVYPSGNLKLPSQTYENYLEWEAKQNNGTIKSLLGQWTPMGPYGKPAGGGAGRLNFVRFDPLVATTIYVGAPDGGLWKTTNGGTSWSTNTDQLTVIGCTDLAINPTNTQIMYLATGDGEAGDSYSVGVLKSIDGGLTWNTTGLNWGVNLGRRISKLTMHPSNPSILIAATSNGIYRTTDAGVTWTQTSTGSFMDLEMHPTNPSIVYVAGSIFRKSTDNGVTWTTITSGLPTTGVQRIAIAVSPANASYVYLLIGRSSDQGLLGVYRSTDSGVTFTLRKGPTGPNLLGWNSNGADAGGQAFYDLSLAVDPNNAEIVLVGGVNVWRSTNGGTNWTIHAHWTASGAPYVHADIHEIIYTSSSTYFVACDGGLFRTTNTGTSFTDISANMQIAQQYRLGLSTSIESKIITGHQDNGTNLANAGAWAQIYGGDGMDCFIDRTNNTTLYGSYVYGDYYRSTNNGGAWTTITTGLPGGTWLSAWHQDPVTANTLYAGGRPALYRSTNQGTNWSALGTPSGSGSIIEFAISPSNNQVIYAVKSNAISRSANGGTSFTNITGTLPVGTVAITNVAVSSTDPNKVWVTFSGYSATNKVFLSTDGGTSWTNISTGLPNVPCNTIVYQNGAANDQVYVGTDIGVFYKDNLQASWTSFFNGLPRCGVRDLEIYYPTGRLRAATFGRGTWESDLHTTGNDPPVADFTATQLVCAGSAVTFTDLSIGAPTTWAWSFPGGTPSSATGAGPHTITYNTVGVYNAVLTATNAFGSDTETKTAYINVVSNTAGALPVVEGFTLATFPPTNWAINNYGIPYTWARTTTAGTAPTVGNSMMFDNYANNHVGSNDEIIMPASNFNGLTSAQLSFDVAYAPYNGAYFDGLEVLVSTNCGGTYTQVYFKDNLTLATDPAITTAMYVPGNWRNEVIDLSAYINNPNVLVMFRNIAGYGQSIYIDNVNLSGTSPTPTASFTTNPSVACTGQSVTFTNTSSGATSWSWNFGVGATPATATGVGPHVVTYATAGVKTTSLSINGGASTANQNVTITAAPNAGTLSGTQTICVGLTTTFASTQAGGTWSSGATGIATVNATTGVVTGVAAGTATITYTVAGSGGCPDATATRTVTVSAAPNAGTLSGTQTICVGLTTTFASTQAGGTWSSGGTGIATVNATTGVVTGVAAGTATITYTVAGSGGCPNATATRTVTVSAAPNAGTLSGTQTICVGLTTTFASTQAGGTWSSGATGIATVNATTGVVTGVAVGTATITYTVAGSGGCPDATATRTVTVSAAPNAGTLSGTQTICVGLTTTFASTQAGGTWSSGATGIATVNATTGVVTGVAAGTATITYTVAGSGGCPNATATRTVTVSAAPNAGTLSGTQTICVGLTTTFASTQAGGTWSSGATGIATVNATTGVVTGVAAGTATITYTVAGSGGCPNATATRTVTVSAAPNAGTLSGTQTICVGLTTTFASTQAGGTWSSGATGIATVNATTGVVTGVAAGTATITYTVAGSGGCPNATATRTVTVSAAPNAGTLSGTQTICVGLTTTFASTQAGGTWSSGATGIATVNATTGVVTGVAAGTATITYTVAGSGGCPNATATRTVTVSAAPNAGTLSGTQTICVGLTTTFASTQAGGTWSSGATGIATVNATTGVVTGVAAGTATITYTIAGSGGCPNATATRTVTVSGVPVISIGTISNPIACATTTGSLQINGVGTGTISWTGTSSGSATGVSLPYTINGLGAGSYSISFTSAAGCASNVLSQSLTDPTPPTTPTITPGGPTTFCAGGSVTLTSSQATGNVWSPGGSTGQTLIATTSGSYSVTYTNVSGCSATSSPIVVTVNATPSAPTITPSGPTTFCAGGSITLTSSQATGNVWSPGGSTGQTLIATTSGSYSVTYTNANGCSATSSPIVVTVNATPSAPTITPSGPTTFCAGGSVSLTSSEATGNVWSPGGSTGQTLIATTSGSYSVTYTNVSGCSATSSPIVVTVNATPSAPTITPSGPTTFCAGGSVTLTSSEATGNVWSPGGSTGQTITATTGGTHSVTYTDANGCSATSSPIVVTVNATPSAPTITPSGPTTFCAGGSVTLTSSEATGNVWSVGGSTGQTFTASTSGTHSVTYTDANGCSATSSPIVVIVNATPSAPTITPSGPTTFCAGGSVTLTSSEATGNVWSVGGSTGQTIAATTAGTYSVAYTDVNGCSATSSPIVVTVNAMPSVTLDPFSDVCLDSGPFGLFGGSPSGGEYTGNGVDLGVFDPAIAGVGVTTLTYTFIDANGCEGSSQATISVDDCSGLEENEDFGFSVFPNPASNVITIVFDEPVEMETLFVYDSQGKLTKSYNELNMNTSFQFDVSDLATGIYYIELHIGNTVLREKMRVQN